MGAQGWKKILQKGMYVCYKHIHKAHTPCQHTHTHTYVLSHIFLNAVHLTIPTFHQNIENYRRLIFVVSLLRITGLCETSYHNVKIWCFPFDKPFNSVDKIFFKKNGIRTIQDLFLPIVLIAVVCRSFLATLFHNFFLWRCRTN